LRPDFKQSGTGARRDSKQPGKEGYPASRTPPTAILDSEISKGEWERAIELYRSHNCTTCGGDKHGDFRDCPCKDRLRLAVSKSFWSKRRSRTLEEFLASIGIPKEAVLDAERRAPSLGAITYIPCSRPKSEEGNPAPQAPVNQAATAAGCAIYDDDDDMPRNARPERRPHELLNRFAAGQTVLIAETSPLYKVTPRFGRPSTVIKMLNRTAVVEDIFNGIRSERHVAYLRSIETIPENAPMNKNDMIFWAALERFGVSFISDLRVVENMSEAHIEYWDDTGQAKQGTP
jgi:hypothetical protein